MSTSSRTEWLKVLDRLARPVLTLLAQGKMRAALSVEAHRERNGQQCTSTYLEAVGRLLTGIAPWLECDGGDDAEKKLRQEYRALTAQALAAGFDPQSPDYLMKTITSQILVDAAFLAHGVLRAPKQLWQNLPRQTQNNLAAALEASRAIRPGPNNWLLFSAMVEAALHRMGRWADPMRVDYALRQHMQWYKGDGVYGDGADFHFDFYNSYVIHPMLRQVAREFHELYAAGEMERIEKRAVRYAAIQERLIMPDGSFPAIGRSICYRGGAFQHLADSALLHALPAEIVPAQVRCALTAVIRKTMGDHAYRPDGFLTIGLAGSQPALGEVYISTGSLYLCSAILLPLGLPPEDEFWAAPDAPWTQVRVWNGENLPADHAYYE